MKKVLSAELAGEIKNWFETKGVKDVIEATEKATEADTGSFEVVITTENVDRYGEVIKLDAWELEHYKNNPVVLWGHDHHTLPVGVCTDITVADGKMVAKGKFAPHDHAQEIRKLYDMGILRATSVGFIEKKREGNCSGSINPDTNLGGNLTTMKEVFHGKTTSFIFNRVQE